MYTNSANFNSQNKLWHKKQMWVISDRDRCMGGSLPKVKKSPVCLSTLRNELYRALSHTSYSANKPNKAELNPDKIDWDYSNCDVVACIVSETNCQ